MRVNKSRNGVEKKVQWLTTAGKLGSGTQHGQISKWDSHVQDSTEHIWKTTSLLKCKLQMETKLTTGRASDMQRKRIVWLSIPEKSKQFSTDRPHSESTNKSVLKTGVKFQCSNGSYNVFNKDIKPQRFMSCGKTSNML